MGLALPPKGVVDGPKRSSCTGIAILHHDAGAGILGNPLLQGNGKDLVVISDVN